MATYKFYFFILLTLLHLTSAHGDILNRTLCFCEENLEPYFLFEYFNVHLNHTFVTNSLDDYDGMAGQYHKQFPLLDNEKTKRMNHAFTYRIFHFGDFYKWDGQKRRASKSWATITESMDALEEICTSICKENFGQQMFKGSRWYRKSWKNMISDQADMCEGCA